MRHYHRGHGRGRRRFAGSGGDQRRSGPYRSRSGMILGVCKGLADYFNLSVFWVRVLTFFCILVTGVWPGLGIYVLGALLLKPEPIIPFANEADQEFYNSYTASRSMAMQRLKRTYDNLDKRLGRLEGAVTDREFDWDRRMHQS